MQFTYVIIASLICYNIYHFISEKKREKERTSSSDLKRNALNCPLARALANENVQRSFGILNSFVSACPLVRSDFRSEMIKRKNSLEARMANLEAILTSAVSEITREKIALKEVAQFLTMRTVLDFMLPDFLLASPASSPPTPSPSTFSSPASSPPTPSPSTFSSAVLSPSYATIIHAANLIDELWRSPDPNNTTLLHSVFSRELLSRLIPMYESQWRVVFYALLEHFRQKNEKIEESEENEEIEEIEEIEKSEEGGNEKSGENKKSKGIMDTRNSNQLVKETLRLYAPVKSVKRKVMGEGEEEKVYVYPLAEVMREKEIWGEDALEFNPDRTYTKNQEEEIKKVFGMGELKCIAGIKFVQDFCGAIIRKVTEEFERVDGGEWEKLPSPLVNVRGMYEDLCVRKV